MSEQMKRRDFLKVGGLAGVALVGAGMMSGCGPKAAGEKASAKKDSWDQEVDVLVVGSGFAGLAAAIEAMQAGAEVALIDKMPVYGGNSSLNGGDMAAVGTPLQKEAGVEDSIDLMVKDMVRTGKSYNHVDRVKLMVEQSAGAVQWCADLGVKFTKLNFHGGHSVPRTNTTSNATGADIVKAQVEKFESMGGKIELKCKLDRLVADEGGRIIGAEVRDRYTLGDEDSGKPRRIRARKAVVLASGGFSNDVKMRQIHEPRLDDKLTSTNHEGATGESLREALKHGAMDVHMDWIQLGPWTSPDEPGFGFCPQFCERMVGWGLMVDPETGRRFVKETGDRKVRADKMLELNRVTLVVGDAKAVEKQVAPRILEGGTKAGVILRFDSLDDIAKEFSMPVDEFKAEVERWNGYVRAGKDPDFDALVLKDAGPIENPPYYVSRLWPKVHHTMGGLYTNLKSQVINQDFEPIPGLYAAGEIAGGTHGAVRLGSCAITDCVVFGRIAGKEAAKEDATA
ncbi:flavocytochrome c [Eggerthellaceae bacterium zg-1084]|uniref:flavocytochrome c n=1 Tax=Berryella wangjianweii TaxID=2734634 RepID=UPI0015571780|nr:flavocytochrome c [Berryella wangjianweii]NPD31200.1 flavocytochrome c [Berryella wangjianweii]